MSSYSLVISAEAQQDETDAYNYYEDVQAGLGESFLYELDKCYSKLKANPQYFSFIGNSQLIRDVQMDRFPYVIVYSILGLRVIVLSVRNTSRKQFYD